MQLGEIWIETNSGIRFFPFRQEENNFNIQDIAHSLSQQCRFNGHTKAFYSVAQHSVLMAKYFQHSHYKPGQILIALLHDAAEAYLGDIVKPIKDHMPVIQIAEYNLLNRIYSWAGVHAFYTEDMRDAVKTVDVCLLHSEKQALLGDKVKWALPTIGLPLTFRIHPWDPRTAKNEFLNMWVDLIKNTK